MQIKRFQEGGTTPVAPAPVQGGQEQAMQQIAQMANEIINQLGPEGAAMLAQAIMEMLQGAQEVGAAPQEQQFMRCGGRIKKAKKCACGSKTPAAACGKKLACGGTPKAACGKKLACGGAAKEMKCGGKAKKGCGKKSC